MNNTEFVSQFGVTIDEAQEMLESMRARNSDEISLLLDRADTKPTALRKQLAWASRCAKCRKIATKFMQGQT